jgi:D-alanyl-D-alanine carboxypeptidase
MFTKAPTTRIFNDKRRRQMSGLDSTTMDGRAPSTIANVTSTSDDFVVSKVEIPQYRRRSLLVASRARSYRRSRRSTMAAAALLATLTLASACSSGDGAVGPTTVTTPTRTAASDLERQMTHILEAHRGNQDFVGAVLAMREADGTTVTVTSGTKELSGDSGDVNPSIPWGIGSTTKTFVAVVVLQLAEEGAIDLDAGIGSYFPNLRGADAITPRQLLQHTSGLNEYLTSPVVLRDARRAWSPMELVAVAEARGRVGEPGGGYNYSNTGYILLGELIARVTSEPWDAAVRERILEPLGMGSTQVGAPNGAPGYGVKDGEFVDYTDRWHPSVGAAAGGLQSTASDLLVFTEALAAGRLLSDSSQAQMETFIPGADLSAFGVVHEQGLGLEKYSNEQLVVYGHLGSGAAHSAFLGFDRRNGTAVVVMMNSDNSGPQAVMAIEALAAIRG